MIRSKLGALAIAAGLTITTAAQAETAQEKLLVGKWDCDARESRNAAMKMLLIYNANNTYRHRYNVAEDSGDTRIDISFQMNGKWNIAKRDTLYEQNRTVNVTNLKLDGIDIHNSALGRMTARQLRNEIAVLSSVIRFKLRFQSADRMTLDDEEITATCTRR